MYKIIMISGALLMAGSMQAVKSDLERLQDAVASGNSPLVKKYLKNYNQPEVASDDDRKKALKNVLDNAEEQVDDLKSSLSITASWSDMAKLGLGTVGLIASSLCSWFFFKKLQEIHESNERRMAGDQEPTIAQWIGLAGSGSVAALCGYVASKGVRCTAQLAKIKSAEVIHELIESHYENIGKALAQPKK